MPEARLHLRLQQGRAWGGKGLGFAGVPGICLLLLYGMRRRAGAAAGGPQVAPRQGAKHAPSRLPSRIQMPSSVSSMLVKSAKASRSGRREAMLVNEWSEEANSGAAHE